ncbi:MAG TPA: ATP-binding cassette domain-containing protein [Roseiarcus sp.]|nr:ATP-binding cassette domain-containing protein [Roseiarcus sp.]
MNAPPLLEVSGLCKRYGGLVAIDRLDLIAPAGAITGIIGPNGAGKSTLIGLIGGALTPSAGTIKLAGRDVTRLPASERARAGIGRTYQIPRPFLDMTVEENLEVAQVSIAPLISAAAARQEREALLVRTGLADAASLPARALPLLRRKRLEVARALALKPRLLLLDEVGAGLVDSEIGELIALIQSILDSRTAIVIVEHVIRIVRECCVRSLVLNFGKALVEGPTSEILANDQVAAIYLGTGGARGKAAKGEEAAQLAGAIHVEAPEAEGGKLAPLVAPASGVKEPALDMRNVAAGYGQARVLKGVSLAIAEGEAVAILGANGAGKTTLARVISGAVAPSAGALRIGGRAAAGLAPHRVAALGVAHCMEGRRIFSSLTVEENLRIAARGVDAATIRRRLGAVYDLFPVLAERKAQIGTALSGGQQQMLAIARALMARPRIVIFDEISLGLAPVIMDKLYEALAQLKRARMTLILIEQDVDRALALADRAYVLEQGVFALSGAARDIAADPRLRHVYMGAAD